MNQIALSLTPAQRASLAAQGVTATDGGGLRSASGAPVSLGTAVAMLAKAGPVAEAVESGAFSRSGIREGGHLLDHDGIEPGDFDRGYLSEGHAAERAHGIGGVPAVAQGAQTRADASDGLHREDVGMDEVGKAVVPFARQFHGRYLTRDHQADSPANTGRANASHIPARHPAEPQDARRGYLAGGHAAPSPGDMPANNAHPAGTPGHDVYGSASAAYNANRTQARADQLMPTGNVSSQPAPAQWSPPPSLSANSVPHPVVVTASQPAPGER